MRDARMVAQNRGISVEKVFRGGEKIRGWRDKVKQSKIIKEKEVRLEYIKENK
jgi:hypothetical protein